MCVVRNLPPPGFHHFWQNNGDCSLGKFVLQFLNQREQRLVHQTVVRAHQEQSGRLYSGCSRRLIDVRGPFFPNVCRIVAIRSFDFGQVNRVDIARQAQGEAERLVRQLVPSFRYDEHDRRG